MKRLLLAVILLTGVPGSAFAASFIASIDNGHVKAGDAFALNLALTDAKPSGDPDIDILKQSFTVVSEEQLSNVTDINGHETTNLGWRITLVPKQQGRFTIPSLAIDTSAGKLHTAPLSLQVDSAAGTSSPVGSGDGFVSITAKVDTSTPYQNQSIRYTVRCEARAGLRNVTLSDIKIDNAIVEDQGQPVVSEAVENGVPVKVAEFHYIITPMQSGKIVIPSVVMEGEIDVPDRVPADPFGGRLMAGMQQIMRALSNFSNGQPFHIVSNQIQLDVKPPAAAMTPWLPLQSLKITEGAPINGGRVGDPFTRKITLSATGAVGSQLPDIEAREDHTNFRVYTDKPVITENIDEKSGAISGQRIETYSLVPQRAGQLVLPAVTVSWWDVVNDRAEKAELPQRVIAVQPGVAIQNAPVASAGQTGNDRAASAQSFWIQRALARGAPLLTYAPLIFVAAIVMIGLFAVFRLWRKIGERTVAEPSAMTSRPRSSKPAQRPLSPDSLSHIHTAQDLKLFLQAYAQEHWGLSRNAPLERIFPVLPQSFAPGDREDATAVVAGLTAAIYAGKSVDIQDLKARTRRVLASLKRSSGRDRRSGDKLPSLNPS